MKKIKLKHHVSTSKTTISSIEVESKNLLEEIESIKESLRRIYQISLLKKS